MLPLKKSHFPISVPAVYEEDYLSIPFFMHLTMDTKLIAEAPIGSTYQVHLLPLCAVQWELKG